MTQAWPSESDGFFKDGRRGGGCRGRLAPSFAPEVV